MNNKDNLNEEREEAITELVSSIDWKRKLTSRKFWVAVCGFITLVLIACGRTETEAKQVAAIVMAGAVVVGYILGEGLTDAAGMSAGTEYEVYEEDEE